LRDAFPEFRVGWLVLKTRDNETARGVRFIIALGDEDHIGSWSDFRNLVLT
jgi:hypothetical protein